MAVGFTTTYAIGAYHHWCCEVESPSGWGEHYVIKFVSDLQQVGRKPVSSTNKTYHQDINVKWNIIESGVKHNQTNENPCKIFWLCSVVFLHFLLI